MSSGERTVVNTDINREVVGYAVNAMLDDQSKREVATLQQRLTSEFGEVIWSMPSDSLHITLLAWLTPLVEYERDTDQLYHDIFDNYDAAFERAIEGAAPVQVGFHVVESSAGAVIIKGQDNGEFQYIRDRFVGEANLPAETKLPPDIIHSSVARYQREQDLQPIIDFVSRQQLSFNLAVSAFYLVRETRMPMLEFEVKKEYLLTGAG